MRGRVTQYIYIKREKERERCVFVHFSDYSAFLTKSPCVRDEIQETRSRASFSKYPIYYLFIGNGDLGEDRGGKGGERSVLARASRRIAIRPSAAMSH